MNNKCEQFLIYIILALKSLLSTYLFIARTHVHGLGKKEETLLVQGTRQVWQNRLQREDNPPQTSFTW